MKRVGTIAVFAMLGFGVLVVGGGIVLWTFVGLTLAFFVALAAMPLTRDDQQPPKLELFMLVGLFVALVYMGISTSERKKVRQAYVAHRAMIECRDADASVASDGKHTPSGKPASAADLTRCADPDGENAWSYRYHLEDAGWNSLPFPGNEP